MNEELRGLYQEVILDHGKNPRRFKKIEPFTHSQEGYNPLCGDQLNLFLNVENGRITDIGFTGQGCAISMASASLMGQALKGKSVQEAEQMFEAFHRLVAEKEDPQQPHDEELLGKLAVLAGVKEFPSRVKCATLAWHTLESILKNKDNPVTTE